MTERDWLKAKDPDLMLDVVTPRLTERKWYLMACMVYRRLIAQMNESEPEWLLNQVEALQSTRIAEPEPDINDLIQSMNNPESFTGGRINAISIETPIRTRPAFEEHIRQLVISCDPDANYSQYLDVSARKTNPAVPYFRAASEAARSAVGIAGQASALSQVAMHHLIQLRGQDLFIAMRTSVAEGLEIVSRANHLVAAAVQLKTLGDGLADQGVARNTRQALAASEHHSREIDERTMERMESIPSQIEKSERKALGRILLEQIGNPFQSYRFEPRWRTDAVVQLARIIYDNHAYDRYPILADALLDADCDEEAILRHVRGAEEHFMDVHHCRGCWVIDLILELDPDVYSHVPLYPSSTPRGRQEPLGLAEPGTHYA